MSRKLEWGLAASLFLLIPSLAQAQRATGVPRPAPPIQMRHVSPSVTTVRTGVTRNTGSRMTTVSTGTNSASTTFANVSTFGGFAPLSVQNLLNPVPGLGFDFNHLAVINSDLDIKAFIDPATQFRLALAERLLRETSFAPGFVPFFAAPMPVVIEQQAAVPEQQPPVIVIQQAPPAGQSAQQPAVVPQPAPEAAAPAPLPDEGQFTLVLRNGQQIEAVAFTHMNDKIVYITLQGGRRTFPASDLDTDATLRINQENGTPLQLPL